MRWTTLRTWTGKVLRTLVADGKDALAVMGRAHLADG